jgi:hypothetical protein
MTTPEEDKLLFEAKRWLNAGNLNGNDSKKRAAAIELIAGPPDGLQTDRLLTLAIAMAEARRG